MNNQTRSLAILFVDDEQMTRKYFKKAFGREFRVLTAESVAEAREVLAEMHEEIGLVITDQRMPNENGVVLLRLIKSEYPQILRMLTTAYSDLEEAIDAVNSGEIMRYIQKPWDLQALKGELSYAIHYAHMRRERDRLYLEKLSVRQRLVAINRVRDLVVMAGSFTHLRSPLAAMQSFLIQHPSIDEVAVDESELDMWGLMESEIESLLTLSSRVATLTQGATEVFTPTSFSTLWPEVESKLLNSKAKVELSILGNKLPEIAAESQLIIQALTLIIEEVALISQSDHPVKLELSGNGGNVLMLSVTAPRAKKGVVDKDISTLRLSAEILSVFFIIYHHSGDVRLADGDAPGFEIVLPTNPNKVSLAPPAPYWLNDVLSSFE